MASEPQRSPARLRHELSVRAAAETHRIFEAIQSKGWPYRTMLDGRVIVVSDEQGPMFRMVFEVLTDGGAARG